MVIFWIRIASILMFIGVALGAFGAHALKGKLDAYYLDVYKTAVLYQFIHALALLGISWLSVHSPSPRIQWAGFCFLFGIVFFSGSLYILSLTGIKVLGAITPIGGVLFLVGWFLIILNTFI